MAEPDSRPGLELQAADNPFWSFSLAVYARSGVAPACLALQERHGLDVNLLLFCLWAGHRGRRLGAAELAGLEAAVGDWHGAVVRPLRAVRRWLKTERRLSGAEPLRRAVKRNELEAERLEQQLLHSVLPLPEGTSDPLAAAANLRALTHFGSVPAVADTRDLATLLQGAFPSLCAARATAILAG